MQQPTFRLPSGIIPGAILALVIIVPLVAAIALDVGFGRSSAAGLTTDQAVRVQRPSLQRSNSEFFDGKVLVQLYVTHPAPPDVGSPATPTPATAVPASSRRAVPMAARRGMLQIRLMNRSSDYVDLDLLEMTSELGDISAGMQRLKLAPGQTAQTGSVLTQQVVTLGQIPVRISLRLGEQEETKDLVLTPVSLAQSAP